MALIHGVMKLINSNYLENRKWSDLFIPQLKRELGEAFINIAPEYKDTQEATDLIVFGVGSLCFACRVRRFEYFERYKNQFTIRLKLPDYKKSELDKIVKEEFGDYYFYGFSNKYNNGSGFIKFIIFDLKIFREYLGYLKRSDRKECWEKRSNVNNSPDFLAFKINCFPPEMIIKEHPG